MRLVAAWCLALAAALAPEWRAAPPAPALSRLRAAQQQTLAGAARFGDVRSPRTDHVSAGALVAADGAARCAAARRTGCLLLCRAHAGVLALAGADRARFLHSQTTNALDGLALGAALDAAVANRDGAALDLVTVATLPRLSLVLASPSRADAVADAFGGHLFPLDDVTLVSAREGRARPRAAPLLSFPALIPTRFASHARTRERANARARGRSAAG